MATLTITFSAQKEQPEESQSLTSEEEKIAHILEEEIKKLNQENEDYKRENKTQMIFGGGYNAYEGKHYGEIKWAAVQAAVPKNYRWYEAWKWPWNNTVGI